MSSNFTQYGQSQMLQALLTPDTFTTISSVEIALSRSVPPANANASQVLEPTATAYARQTYSTGSTYWAPTGFGPYYNTLLITFPQVDAEEWGLIRGYAVIEPISGQCLQVGSIKSPFRATTGYVPKLEAGTVVLGFIN